eukprot:PITA_30186
MIVPYTPEQNGLDERKNRSILEVSHFMLHDQKVQKFLWAKATSTVVYVQNKVPHQALEKKNPQEIFIDATLGKVRDLPSPPPPKEENVHRDVLDGPSITESDMLDDPIDPMDPLDPPPSDPPSKKRPLWLCDTLQDPEINVPIRRSFKERKQPFRLQGYVASMNNMIQVEPSSFEEAVKEKIWKDAMAE